MNVVIDPKIRRQLATTIVLLGLAVLGSAKGLQEFNAFQDSLSPSAQTAFTDLSYWQQARLFETATRMGASPEALEFYLNEIDRLGSPLVDLPLADGLRVSSFIDNYGPEMMTRLIPFFEKYGINMLEVLERSTKTGRSPVGEMLGIESLNNPANHSYIKINLTDTELNRILTQNIKNPNSKVVVLGFGSDAAKPYYILGDEITGSFLSLSAESWAPFENARANFLLDINLPFIDASIASRKIFLFNVDYDVLIDPKNVQRFSLPELRLIQLEVNNYVRVSVGEYLAFVPAELLDTYEQYLPADILSGE